MNTFFKKDIQKVVVVFRDSQVESLNPEVLKWLHKKIFKLKLFFKKI